MRRQILITGASGRFGSALAAALSADHDLVQLSLDAPASDRQGNTGRVLIGNVTDAALVRDAMDGVDTVIHCASWPGAIEPFDRLMATNVLGVFTMLEEAGRRREVRQFLHMSSLTWHGLHEQRGGAQVPHFLPITEAHPSLARGYFDTSKVLAEHLCEVYTKRFKKPCVALRPGWIITPELEPQFKAVPPVDGPHLNDYIGASDLVDAVVRLFDYDPPDGFEAMLFHADDQRSTMPSVELARRYYKSVRCDEERLRRCEGFGALVDCSRAGERIGWIPRYGCGRD